MKLYLVLLESMIVNPQCMHSEAYGSCPVSVCLCVSVSAFSILPSCTFRCAMRGISGYSAENCTIVCDRNNSIKCYKEIAKRL